MNRRVLAGFALVWIGYWGIGNAVVTWDATVAAFWMLLALPWLVVRYVLPPDGEVWIEDLREPRNWYRTR